MRDLVDFYKLLHVTPDAPVEVIKAAYRAIGKKAHPDLNGGQAVFEQWMTLVNEAHRVLGDTALRASYDAQFTSPTKTRKGSSIMCHLEKVGNRVYVRGNSFAIKDQIKSAGAHWAADERAWWIGAKKADELQSIIDKAASGTSSSTSTANQPQSDPLDREVKGRAKYKGNQAYIAWNGQTKKGEAYKLVSLDGAKEWWADPSEVEVIKQYGREERGAYGKPTGRTVYPTIKSLRDFADSKKAEKDNDPSIWTRSRKMEHLDMLDQCDRFQEAERFAREHGLPY